MQRELEDDAPEGVLDEIGVLGIHSGYAEQLFPGTSVLHTRPRYLFFTCWNYLFVADKGGRVKPSNFQRHKSAAESWVALQLRQGGEQRGNIGYSLYETGQVPVVEPDRTYWNALTRWGFYAGPRRAQLLSRWDGKQVRRQEELPEARDDTIRTTLATFNVTAAPEWWQRPGRGGLSFDLEPEEARFLAQQLVLVRRQDMGRCLLAEAAQLLLRGKRGLGGHGWFGDVPLIRRAAAASGQEQLLDRAGLAASFAEVLRAIYGALVERTAELYGPQATAKALGRQYRDQLRAYWRPLSVEVREARSLDLDALRQDLPKLEKDFLALMTLVQRRLLEVRKPTDVDGYLLDRTLRQAFSRVEVRRKGYRARLPQRSGFSQRRDFDVHTVTVAPLHYRGAQVLTLLRDVARGLAR